MAIDPARQLVREALLQEVARRAITTGKRTESKSRDQANQEPDSEAPAADEAQAGPDAGNVGSDCQSRRVFTRARAPHCGLHPSSLNSVVARACLRAGLPQVAAHRMRHTAATEMLRAGSSLREVGQVLRHRSTEITSIYAKVDRLALVAVVQQWPRAPA